MKSDRLRCALLAFVCACLAGFLVATAPVASAVTVDWVGVCGSETPNPCDPLGCFGSVANPYLIGKYEVTNAQYAEFLNAVAYDDTNDLYNSSMGDPSEVGHGGITRSGSAGSYSYSTIAGRESMPVNWVSFYDALRFANWLHNGQPIGLQDASTTEDGAYTMIVEDYLSGPVIVRNPGATVFLPSEDEWYKAAYYDAFSASYFGYPAGTDVATICALPSATPNTANCGATVRDVAVVGSYTGSASPSGTFDQGGNVREWNEAIFLGSVPPDPDWARRLRGGRFDRLGHRLAATYWAREYPTFEAESTGFRVASIAEDQCSDGFDSDCDGFTDFVGGDPGCVGADDLSENDPTLICDDGADNDSDGLADYPEDPGCRNPNANLEDPACQDGQDNDGDGLIDFDGGQSIWGECTGQPGGCPLGVSDLGGDGVPNPDPQCANSFKTSETPSGNCGLGAELAALLPGLLWLYGRRRKTS